MPETLPKSVFDMAPDDAHEAVLDAQSEADIAAGSTIPYARAREWLEKNCAVGEGAAAPDA